MFNKYLDDGKEIRNKIFSVALTETEMREFELLCKMLNSTKSKLARTLIIAAIKQNLKKED